jgi:GTPase SAR1 family protein
MFHLKTGLAVVDNMVRLLIGTKSDETDKRQVTREEAEEMAGLYNITYMETSAKESLQVTDAFEALAFEVEERNSTTR